MSGLSWVLSWWHICFCKAENDGTSLLSSSCDMDEALESSASTLNTLLRSVERGMPYREDALRVPSLPFFTSVTAAERSSLV